MYAEGQTLKITATATSPYSKIFRNALIVTVVDVNDNRMRVQLSSEDAALEPRGRDVIGVIFEGCGPTFYPDWTIEIVSDAPTAQLAEVAPVVTPAPKLMSRDEWNNYKNVYDVNVPEDSYEEYLAARTEPEQATYTVRLPDVGWVRGSKFETGVVIEEKLNNGNRISVAVTDDSRRADYIIDEALILDDNNQIVEYLTWNQIRLLAYFSGEEVKTSFSEFWPVMTAGEAVTVFGVAEATVRQAINRKQISARKSGGTWLILRKDAEARWGKK